MFREAAGYTGQMVGNRTRKKADLQWHRGVYLGRAEQTNEHIVGSRTGIFQTRNVRRLPADQRRDAEGVRGMVGVPWAAQRVMAAPKPKNPAAGALPAPATPVPGSAAAAAGPQAAQAASSVSSGSSSSSGLDGAQAAPRNTNLEHGASASEGGASSSAAAAAVPMQQDVPSEMKKVLMSDEPTAKEARDFWGSFGSEIQARAKKAREAGVSLDKAVADSFETVDEHLDPTVLGDVMNEATDMDVAEETLRRSRQDEIEVMAKFKAYEAVDRKDYAGHKILKTRFVDTEEKSRFVAKEYNTGATDEFFAQATTMTTGRLVDAMACKHRHSRMILDVHRAFLHLPEDETV